MNICTQVERHFLKGLKGYTPNFEDWTLCGRESDWGPGVEGNFHFSLSISVYNLKCLYNFAKTKVSDEVLAILCSAFCFCFFKKARCINQ